MDNSPTNGSSRQHQHQHQQQQQQQQQLLALQALRNGTLQLNAPVGHSHLHVPQSNHLSGIDFARLDQTLSPTVAASLISIATQRRLQEQIDALKRQNRAAISKLLIARRQNSETMAVVPSESSDQNTVVASLLPRPNTFVNNGHPMITSALTNMLAMSDQFHNEQHKVAASTTVDESSPQMTEAAISVTDPKPKRPLSAYNIFFQEERRRLIGTVPKNEVSTHHDVTETCLPKPESTTSVETTDSESSNPKKRKRYEPHRKMSFEDMGRKIAQGWRDLASDKSRMNRYRHMATVDKERYQKELLQWNLRRKN